MWYPDKNQPILKFLTEGKITTPDIPILNTLLAMFGVGEPAPGEKGAIRSNNPPPFTPYMGNPMHFVGDIAGRRDVSPAEEALWAMFDLGTAGMGAVGHAAARRTDDVGEGIFRLIRGAKPDRPNARQLMDEYAQGVKSLDEPLDYTQDEWRLIEDMHEMRSEIPQDELWQYPELTPNAEVVRSTEFRDKTYDRLGEIEKELTQSNAGLADSSWGIDYNPNGIRDASRDYEEVVKYLESRLPANRRLAVDELRQEAINLLKLGQASSADEALRRAAKEKDWSGEAVINSLGEFHHQMTNGYPGQDAFFQPHSNELTAIETMLQRAADLGGEDMARRASNLQNTIERTISKGPSPDIERVNLDDLDFDSLDAKVIPMEGDSISPQILQGWLDDSEKFGREISSVFGLDPETSADLALYATMLGSHRKVSPPLKLSNSVFNQTNMTIEQLIDRLKSDDRFGDLFIPF